MDNKQAEYLLKEWEPKVFSSTFSEYVADKFLEYIAKGNYGTPVEFYPKSLFGIVSKKEKAGKLKEVFKNISITNYSIVEILDDAPAITIVKADIWLKKNGDSEFDVVERIEFRLIYEIDG